MVLASLAGYASLPIGCARSNAQPPSEPDGTDPPNMVLVVLDTLRADHLGCYGYSRNTSPRIDAFAAAATKYRRCVAAAPWTIPTHASLFTGLFPFEHGVHTYKGPAPTPDDLLIPLAPDHTTLAETLRAEGYRTAAFMANSGYLDPVFQLDQGFDVYRIKHVWSAELNELVFDWLDDNAARPFLLFINYIDPHRPYNTTPRPGLLDQPAVRDNGELLDALVEHVLSGKGPAPAELVGQVIDQYDTGIGNADESVGALLDRLTALGLYDSSVIVLTSDHGEHFGDHQLVEHSKDVYESALWVPLIIKTPGQQAPAVVGDLTATTDLPRLMLAHLPAAMAARCLPAFPDAPGNHLVVAENYYTRAKDLYDPRWGRRFDRVRTTAYDWPYKLIFSSDKRHELYNLETDPDESRNLLTIEPQVAVRLADRLRTFRAERLARRKPAAAQTQPAPMNPDLREQLESLGYVADDPKK